MDMVAISILSPSTAPGIRRTVADPMLVSCVRVREWLAVVYAI